ncbi:MAG: hypothetical protein PHD81_01405 [Candidatus Nanoarchaeia archaeon]|nr:hypothetical protein [Candidatus Nanoarchaeia archaeon]MDD5587745.1 hypothetical protein [Candidatus Nanoarchaeia archaeon]
MDFNIKNCTLCYSIKGEQILLGIKKKGFGKGNLNGFGGHVEDNETIKNSNIQVIM